MNLENRFTGWVDVDLTEKGESEAKKAGQLIKENNIEIQYYYSSLQLRANNTLKIIQKILNDERDYMKSWKINERHYGALSGLNKIQMLKKIGEDKIYEFRDLGMENLMLSTKRVLIILSILKHTLIYLEKLYLTLSH